MRNFNKFKKLLNMKLHYIVIFILLVIYFYLSTKSVYMEPLNENLADHWTQEDYYISSKNLNRVLFVLVVIEIVLICYPR